MIDGSWSIARSTAASRSGRAGLTVRRRPTPDHHRPRHPAGPRSPAAALGPRREHGPEVGGGGVDGDHERPGGGVADDRDRGRVDHDPLEAVQVHAERVGQDRLDRVAVGHRGPDGVGAVLRSELARPSSGWRRPPGPTSRSSTPRPGSGRRTAGAAPRPKACPCSARAATCRSTPRSRTPPGPARPRSGRRRRRAATRACAVCRQRRSGEVTTALTGTAAIRAAASATCSLPTSSSTTPGGPPGQDAGRVGGGAPMADQQDRGHRLEATGSGGDHYRLTAR